MGDKVEDIRAKHRRLSDRTKHPDPTAPSFSWNEVQVLLGEIDVYEQDIEGGAYNCNICT